MANSTPSHRTRAIPKLVCGRTSTAGRRQDAELGEPSKRELVALLQRRTEVEGRNDTPIPQLRLYRYSQPTESANVVLEPAIYVVVQGRKRVIVGAKAYYYDPSQYLAVSVDLPAAASVSEASPDAPYLCLTLSVDPRDLAALIVETARQAPRDDHDGRALYVSALGVPLLDGLLRLVRLLDTPRDIRVLAPLILREINYRLLDGEQAGRLAQIAIGDGRLRRVSGAITWIKEHFREPLEIATLARQVNMSPSTLHHYFKAVAAISPVQYQKRLRLHEARNRLVSGASSAEAIAREVGYESASQFSREYARLFGQPPRRDAERVRDEVV